LKLSTILCYRMTSFELMSLNINDLIEKARSYIQPR
jgi:hypothetical protein